MRVAITGASGVLGPGSCRQIAEQGHQVVGIARHRPESWLSAADFVRSRYSRCSRGRARDNRRPTSSRTAHGARSPGPGQPASASRSNVDGTRNVLEAMGKSGTGRIVFVSSAHVPTVRGRARPPKPMTSHRIP
ncbi:NAD-dependent epimerase/dehydratase family protein [Mycobacterium kansasii]|uniref:NAD-dependent epimerase/dehydratase family protein n=1 Tax=Mycobacterium kansasii TaxID=1768 RepID=UPI0009B84A26